MIYRLLSILASTAAGYFLARFLDNLLGLEAASGVLAETVRDTLHMPEPPAERNA
jgi:hypothetical protein